MMYRYTLRRRVDDLFVARGTLLWVMLNPSTATDDTDDPTIRKCLGFTKRWGFRQLSVVNLYAMRATKPAELWGALKLGADAIGPENNATISAEAAVATAVVVAWGRLPKVAIPRSRVVTSLLGRTNGTLMMVRANGDGSPMHPLMATYSQEPHGWST